MIPHPALLFRDVACPERAVPASFRPVNRNLILNKEFMDAQSARGYTERIPAMRGKTEV